MTNCLLVALDYSQLELRIAAHMSQDSSLLQAYRDGDDVHELTRSWIFGDKPDETQRRVAKSVNFGVLYGVSGKGLLDIIQKDGMMDYTVQDCSRFIRVFMTGHKGYKDWVTNIRAEAVRTGMVRNLFGRIKWCSEVQSTVKRVKEQGLRAAVNFPIQATAADIIKIAMAGMVPVYESWVDIGLIVRPVLQVHDEMVFEVEEEIVDWVVPELKHVMENAVVLDIPLLVDVKVGLNWGEMEVHNE